MKSIDEIVKSIEEKQDIYIKVCDRIWGFAETRFEEYKSSELLRRILKEEGFRLTEGIADMKTAFVACYGSGKPIIAFLGEFDALYGMSQKSDVPVKEPIVKGGKGHGCGHHALGTGAMAAAIAVKDYMKKNNIQGTVRFYGCPGEESGSGKAYIAREGYFDDVDAALTWHPGSENAVWSMNFLATLQVYFKFHGKSAHAAACPHLGRSSLDAVELMNVGANFLREHVIQEARIHYAITDGGGLSPNVVQANAAVLYQIRAPKMQDAKAIYDRVVNIAKGAALMTDTELEIVFDRGSSNLILNDTLDKLLYKNFEKVGPVAVDKDDIEFAKEIRETLSSREKRVNEEKLSNYYGSEAERMAEKIRDKEVIDIVYPYRKTNEVMPGSTDVGDVSWNTPTAQITTVCYAKDTPGHSWQLVAQGKEKLFHKGMLEASKVLALSGIELFENHELIEKAKSEFRERLGTERYKCPIPKHIKPSPIR